MVNSFKLKNFSPLSTNTVGIFLGYNYYHRLFMIYDNVCRAIAYDDWKYLG